MFREIYNYGKSLEYTSSAFEKTKAHWEILLSTEPTVIPSILELFIEKDVSDKKGNIRQKKTSGKEFNLPYTSKDALAAGGLSRFLSDTIDRIFGGGDNKENSKSSKDYFKQQILSCYQQTSNPFVKVVLDFLNDENQLKMVFELLKNDKAKDSDRIIFSVDYKYIHDELDVKEYWENKRTELINNLDKTSRKGMCLITGNYTSLARTWKDLKKVPGANPTGAKLCSCDKNAFSHYNKEDTYNSPVSIKTEELINRGFQTLIDKGRTIGKDNNGKNKDKDKHKYIYWTENNKDVDPFEAVENPNVEDVTSLLDSVFSGNKSSAINLQDELFYMATLSGNGGRVVLRGWYEEPLFVIKNNLKSWFDDISIYDNYSKTIKSCFSINSLVCSTLLRDKDEKFIWTTEHPKIRTDLVETAIKRSKLSQYILNLIVERDLKDIIQKKSTPSCRLALLKLCVNRINNNIVDEKLIMKNETVAYLCGKLMKVLDLLHWSAMGDKSTLYRRVYSASVTPKSVICEIVNRSQVYIKIANVKYPGSGTNRSKEITELVNKINNMGGFPATLNKNEQAEFCCGFHSEKV